MKSYLWQINTNFCGHFIYIKTLWKVLKLNMKWPNSIQWDGIEMFCSRHTFLWPYMVSCRALQRNIRWGWSIWKSSITTHPTLSSNGTGIFSKAPMVHSFKTFLNNIRKILFTVQVRLQPFLLIALLWWKTLHWKNYCWFEC